MVEFAGIISKSTLEGMTQEIEQMLSVMSLPATDHKKFLSVDQNTAFGQTSLPIESEFNQNYMIGVQGEINNFPEIKQKLLDKGQVVESEDPSALLILAYQTWGPTFLSLLNGGFILFIFDRREKKLLIGRDKIGSHRIYWGRFSNTFVFASLLKGLLASRFVPQHPCLESIASYFYLGYFPQDKTPIVNLNCLLPGYYLMVDSDVNVILNKYWSFQDSGKVKDNTNLDEVSERLNHLLIQAIEKSNPKNEDMTSYLHGDIGSAALAHYMNKMSPKKSSCFSNDFEGQANSYMPYAQRVSDSFQLPFEKEELKFSDLFNELSQIVWHLDEPIADPSSVLIWNMAKNLKGRTKKLYTSLGCSEFLGIHLGNSSLSYKPLFLWFLKLSSPLFTRVGIPLLSKVSKQAALSSLRFFQKDFWATEYMEQNALYSSSALKKMAPDLYKQFDLGIYIHQTYQYLKYIHSQNFDIADYSFYDAETTLCNYSLIQYQNILLSHDIDLHCPFLDEDLVHFLIHTPEVFKSHGKSPALPLQKILQESLSQEDLNYEYQKGNHYLDDWLQNPEIEEIYQFLFNGTLCESGIISEKGLRDTFKKRNLDSRAFEKLWSILVLEVWFKLFINRPVYTYPEKDTLIDPSKKL